MLRAAGHNTYVWTWEGWMYLLVIDIASRRVVGWAMADHLRAELVCDALRHAVTRRRPPPGVVFHADYAEDRVKPRNGGVGVCRRGLLTGSSA